MVRRWRLIGYFLPPQADFSRCVALLQRLRGRKKLNVIHFQLAAVVAREAAGAAGGQRHHMAGAVDALGSWQVRWSPRDIIGARIICPPSPLRGGLAGWRVC
jgi:hypothetical protein